MHLPISLLIVAALATCTLCLNEECTENEICSVDDPEVCIFHLDKYCFIKYDNVCAWNEVKCLFGFDHKEYALGYCDLENFACRFRKKKHVNTTNFNSKLGIKSQ